MSSKFEKKIEFREDGILYRVTAPEGVGLRKMLGDGVIECPKCGQKHSFGLSTLKGAFTVTRERIVQPGEEGYENAESPESPAFDIYPSKKKEKDTEPARKEGEGE